MVKRKKIPDLLPALYLQNGHTVSSVIVALNGMMPGQYGDMHTGGGPREYVHVSRLPDGTWRAVNKASSRSFQTGNATRLAQFIINQMD